MGISVRRGEGVVMAKPAILIIDDDLQVLNSVERDLRAHFRSEYRLVKASSGQEALEAVQQLKRRDVPVALFLVDQRMPNMTGTEFLAKAQTIYPDARKVLLTAYADTNAAITSINEIGLDYYLMKPWDPPEEHLYPVLDDLLSDWKAITTVTYEGIRVAGTLWSESSHVAKDFLARNQIPYQWLDIEKDDEARQLVESINQEEMRLPVIFFPNGSYLINPSLAELADKTGMQTRAAKPFYDLAIIGAGPAGLAAAVYGASEGLRTVMIERAAAGGQAGTSSRIENYLGFPNGLSGADLARRAVTQALKFGVEILAAQEVTSLRSEDSYRFIRMQDGSEISCHALLIASGVSVRRLVVPGVERLTGAGVYYGAALTEAAYYRDQDVAIVGGANSAGQAAIFFSRYARSVFMLVRGSSLEMGMSQYLVDQIRALPNVEPIFQSEVIEVKGQNRLEEICVQNRLNDEIHTIPASAMFIFIGAVPRTDMVADLVERDSAGFILTGPDLLRKGKRPSSWSLKRDPYLLETSCPGIFAAGDVRHGSIKRVGAAVGEGAVTIAFVHQYLKTV
jgi:thioredoxin reductase (NADPH)